ncbi:hypothetical protein JMA_07200 [Jeotgalibacillus malaysiensis]|uniref:Uncharacterized protein n=1 Tax=Jeotgalibacillus malaysiensis TaxID=1508404 RepID=A0A0B5AMZ5_9BACL|nr:hypothetical protein [Jeotgalibacillus malaysiensis]AJD90037.1 hypothetical protein JMA_07200 [Jeotgalibacillus malaysiensis]
MSLATVSTGDVIRQQVIYKWYSFTELLRSLVFMQVIAIIFSAIGTGGMGTSDDMFSLEVTTYSANIVFAFTLFWLLVTPAMITSKNYMYEDFSYVTTRLITQISNAIFFVAVTLIATVFTVLSSYLIYLIMSLTRPAQYFPGLSTVGSPGELFIAGAGIFGYYLIAVAIGYLFGALLKISKLFFVLIPMVLFVPGLLDAYFFYEFLNMFYVQESSLLLFLFKAVLTALAGYGAAVLILNKREVREA